MASAGGQDRQSYGALQQMEVFWQIRCPVRSIPETVLTLSTLSESFSCPADTAAAPVSTAAAVGWIPVGVGCGGWRFILRCLT